MNQEDLTIAFLILLAMIGVGVLCFSENAQMNRVRGHPTIMVPEVGL